MTNQLAIILGILIFGFFAMDQVVYDGDIIVFLGKKLRELSDYIAFWR